MRLVCCVVAVLSVAAAGAAGATARGFRSSPVDPGPFAGDDNALLAGAAAGDGTTPTPEPKQPGKKEEDDGDEERKTLSQQIADGKYGLIQKELYPRPSLRPGIISYKANPEVPRDSSKTLGGLEAEEIWLAEDHVLVLRGGWFPNHSANRSEPVWPAIDTYRAPPRQVKLPARPRVPPPFPVQLAEGGPLEFIGPNGTRTPFPPPFFPPPLPGNFPPGAGFYPPAPGNGSLYPPLPPPYPPPGGGSRPPPALPPPLGPLPPLPPGAALLPPPGNQTEPDEDDPSIYYPPPYDFFYPVDNSSAVPAGPLVPGIVLPPPPDFFAPLDEPKPGRHRPRPRPPPPPPVLTYLPVTTSVRQRKPRPPPPPPPPSTTAGPEPLPPVDLTTPPLPAPPPSDARPGPPRFAQPQAVLVTHKGESPIGSRPFYLDVDNVVTAAPPPPPPPPPARPDGLTRLKDILYTTPRPVVTYQLGTVIDLTTPPPPAGRRPPPPPPDYEANAVAPPRPPPPPLRAPKTTYYFYEEPHFSQGFVRDITTPRPAPPPPPPRPQSPEEALLAQLVATLRQQPPPPPPSLPAQNFFSSGGNGHNFFSTSRPGYGGFTLYSGGGGGGRPRPRPAFYLGRLPGQAENPLKYTGPAGLEAVLQSTEHPLPPPSRLRGPDRAVQTSPKTVYEFSFQSQAPAPAPPPHTFLPQPHRYRPPPPPPARPRPPAPYYEAPSLAAAPSTTPRPKPPRPSPKPRPAPAPAHVTPNPLQHYYTQQDEGLLDDITKKYFTIFGQKLPAERLGGPTTPLPLPLHDDILVNYLHPRPTADPDSEDVPGHHGAEGGELVTYPLPGSDGGHVYFVTPQDRDRDRRSRRPPRRS